VLTGNTELAAASPIAMYAAAGTTTRVEHAVVGQPRELRIVRHGRRLEYRGPRREWDASA
jgi:hypothetical protein